MYKDQIPDQQEVIINLFDSNGRLVHQLLPRQMKDVGIHTLLFHTNDLQAGIYFIDIQTTQQRIYRKLSVLGQR